LLSEETAWRAADRATVLVLFVAEPVQGLICGAAIVAWRKRLTTRSGCRDY